MFYWFSEREFLCNEFAFQNIKQGRNKQLLLINEKVRTESSQFRYKKQGIGSRRTVYIMNVNAFWLIGTHIQFVRGVKNCFLIKIIWMGMPFLINWKLWNLISLKVQARYTCTLQLSKQDMKPAKFPSCELSCWLIKLMGKMLVFNSFLRCEKMSENTQVRFAKLRTRSFDSLNYSNLQENAKHLIE